MLRKALYTQVKYIKTKHENLIAIFSPSITEGFQPSQNIIEKPLVYRFFSSFRYTFMHYFLYKIDLCFAFFHLKCTETFQRFSKYIGFLDLERVGQY